MDLHDEVFFTILLFWLYQDVIYYICLFILLISLILIKYVTVLITFLWY